MRAAARRRRLRLRAASAPARQAPGARAHRLRRRRCRSISPVRITRLAPSPTGALHLGNARTFLINWLLARQNGWKIILRIEDLDGPRIKKGADQQAIDDLRWLGIDWDEGPIYQSSRRD